MDLANRTAGILLLLLPVVTRAAAGDAFRPITPAGVRSGEFRLGERRSITGQFQEMINREIKLYDIEARLLIGREQLPSLIQQLKPQKSNITLSGRFRGPVPGDPPAQGNVPIFEIEDVKLAPSALEIFEGRLRELLAQRNAAGEPFWEISDEIASRLRRENDPQLASVARKCLQEGYSRSEAPLAPTDADGRLDLIRRVHDSLGDSSLTLELIRVQVRRFPDHERTLALIRELRFLRWRGDWIGYDEYKKRLGFILADDQWLKPARREFMDILRQVAKEKDNEATLILRSRTDREYSLLAQSGKVERGMTREELAEALGLPDRVEREILDTKEVDQWSYGEKRVYLLNGQVIAATQ